MAGAVIMPKFDLHRISSGLKADAEAVRAHIIQQLTYIGEECVRIAREGGSYNDITGNLRSSIGYVVMDDGRPIVQGQPQRFKKGSDGTKAAKEFLDKLQGEFPKGIVLIVCAGMRYASYVEEIHHKDVLASAELAAKSLVQQLLRGIVD